MTPSSMAINFTALLPTVVTDLVDFETLDIRLAFPHRRSLVLCALFVPRGFAPGSDRPRWRSSRASVPLRFDGLAFSPDLGRRELGRKFSEAPLHQPRRAGQKRS
jgi:hypothetical protein